MNITRLHSFELSKERNNITTKKEKLMFQHKEIREREKEMKKAKRKGTGIVMEFRIFTFFLIVFPTNNNFTFFVLESEITHDNISYTKERMFIYFKKRGGGGSQERYFMILLLSSRHVLYTSFHNTQSSSCTSRTKIFLNKKKLKYRGPDCTVQSMKKKRRGRIGSVRLL